LAHCRGLTPENGSTSFRETIYLVDDELDITTICQKGAGSKLKEILDTIDVLLVDGH